jgi:enoyl-[acyl-carrier protein] reductase I
MNDTGSHLLEGHVALVIGIANEHSIACGCARAFRNMGAELAITYLNDKARHFVEPIARQVEATVFMPLDVRKPGELEAVFDRIRSEHGRLDIALHSIAFAPKEDLQGGLLGCSSEGFARLAVNLMTDGGTLFAMSYYGADKVVPNYGVMGPVKAALESAVRYLAYELGPRGIRVHAISPGPIETRAASGLKDFDLLVNEAIERSPVHEPVNIDDIGAVTAFLATPYARRLTGTTTYVDAGRNIVA